MNNRNINTYFENVKQIKIEYLKETTKSKKYLKNKKLKKKRGSKNVSK